MLEIFLVGALHIFGIFARERILLGLKKARANGRSPTPKREQVDLQLLSTRARQGAVFGVSKDTIRSLLQRPALPV